MATGHRTRSLRSGDVDREGVRCPPGYWTTTSGGHRTAGDHGHLPALLGILQDQPHGDSRDDPTATPSFRCFSTFATVWRSTCCLTLVLRDRADITLHGQFIISRAT